MTANLLTTSQLDELARTHARLDELSALALERPGVVTPAMQSEAAMLKGRLMRSVPTLIAMARSGAPLAVCPCPDWLADMAQAAGAAVGPVWPPTEDGR